MPRGAGEVNGFPPVLPIQLSILTQKDRNMPKKKAPKYTVRELKTAKGQVYKFQPQPNSTTTPHYSTNEHPKRNPPKSQPSMSRISMLYYLTKGSFDVNIFVWGKLARSRDNIYEKGDQPDVHFTIATDRDTILNAIVTSKNATDFVNYFEEYTNYAVSHVYSIGMAEA